MDVQENSQDGYIFLLKTDAEGATYTTSLPSPNTTAAPTPTPTTTPSATPVTPEFPSIIIVAVLLVAA